MKPPDSFAPLRRKRHCRTIKRKIINRVFQADFLTVSNNSLQLKEALVVYTFSSHLLLNQASYALLILSFIFGNLKNQYFIETILFRSLKIHSLLVIHWRNKHIKPAFLLFQTAVLKTNTRNLCVCMRVSPCYNINSSFFLTQLLFFALWRPWYFKGSCCENMDVFKNKKR